MVKFMDKHDLPLLATTEHKDEMGRRLYDENGNGNGWSRYQIMVLQQLTDHTKLLQALMSEINTIKQQIAISDIISKNWRDQADKSIQELKEDVDFIMEDEGGINQRLRHIEENAKVEEKSTLKVKAFWGLLGGVIVVVVDFGIKLINIINTKLQFVLDSTK
jgi:hypothetical protein